MRDPIHVRVLRALLRLYPSDFRRRHGNEILAIARAEARNAGRARPMAVIADASTTLARAWLDVTRAAGARMADGLRTGALADGLARDAALGIRSARRRPLHAIAVIATLAIALGANAAIYTVTHALLLERLPYSDPERIVEVEAPPVRMVRVAGESSWAVGRVLLDHLGVEAAATYYRDASANLVAGDEASRVRIAQVSATLFDVLGARMRIGTGLDPDGGNDAVLSDGLWRSAFGGDPSVIGRTILLNGRGYRIAGVAPRGFDFPAETQLWLSDPPVMEFYGSALGPSVVARIRPGAFAAVQRSLAEHAAAERADAGEYAKYLREARLIPLRQHLTRDVRLPLIVLAAAAAVVLLLGCVNVAGVSIAQITARAPELAVRRALGARATRLFAQLFAELLVLAAAAGVLAVAVASASLPALVRLLPAGTPGLDGVRLGAWTLLFTGGATIIAALVAGVPAALAGARGAGLGAHPDRLRVDERGRHRVQGMLSSIQVALAVMLVVAASLLGRSLARLQAVPLGYDIENVLTFSVRLPQATYPDAESRRRYAEEVAQRLAALPGVEDVGITDRLPLAEGLYVGGGVRRPDMPEDAAVSGSLLAVSDDYFAAMGIPMVSGRAFTATDDSPRSVILSRQLAQALFADAPAVGATVVLRRPGGAVHATVVGVASDTRLRMLEEPLHPAFYIPLRATATASPAFALRTRDAPASLTPAVRRVLAEVDAAVAPFALRTTGAAVAETIAARRATAIVATLFGAASLLLALMAVYTMLAQSIARRRREMGIRLALGATARRIEGFIVGRGMTWTLGGVGAGVLASIGATRLLEGMLFGVAPRDPLVLGTTAVAVMLAAVLASWIPARRAGRVDPAESLRET